MAIVTPIVHTYLDVVDEFDVLTNTGSGNGENTLPYINLLKAILVNGYNGKPALGWTIEAEDLVNHRIRFRDPSNKFTLQIKSANAMGWSTTYDDYSIFTFAENFTDWDVYSNHIWECSFGAYSSNDYVWYFVGYGSQFVFTLTLNSTTYINNYLKNSDSRTAYSFITVQKFEPVESNHAFPYFFSGGATTQSQFADGYYHTIADDDSYGHLRWYMTALKTYDAKSVNASPHTYAVAPFNKDGVYQYEVYEVYRQGLFNLASFSGLNKSFTEIKKMGLGHYILQNNTSYETSVSGAIAGFVSNMRPAGARMNSLNASNLTIDENTYSKPITYNNGEQLFLVKNQNSEDFLDFVRIDQWQN